MEQMPSTWMTPGANASAPGGQNPNAGLMVRFHMGSLLNAERTAKAGGVPKYDSVRFITIAVPGDRSILIDRPVWDDETNPESDTQRWPQQWAAFNAGKSEDVLTGTPLVEWALVTRAQADELAHYHIQTVEQLAALSDGNCQKYMGSLQLRQKAREWLTQAEKAAPFMVLTEKLKGLEEQNEALKAALEQTNARLGELPGAPAAKPSLRKSAQSLST